MKFAVLGSGKMGRAAVYDLARGEGVTGVTIFDIDEDSAKKVAHSFGAGKTTAQKIDVAELNPRDTTFAGFDAVISAVTYKYNPLLTQIAINSRAHFFDLGGNNDAVAAQFALDGAARQANVVVIPDCGLAPGMVSVLVAAGIREFDKTLAVRIRVGGLPQRPRPPLNYQMVFSAEGLINEYWEPVVILENGDSKTVTPMSAVEDLEFPGHGKLEAFYTSGGTSTLPQTYRNSIDFLDYKTIRYPGHCAMFRPMLEIGLASREKIVVEGSPVEPRAVLKAVLDRNLTFPGEPDMVFVRVSFDGIKDGRAKSFCYEIVDREDSTTGLTAMMRTTSFPIAIIAWMAASGKITARGVVPQEVAVDPDIFMSELGRRGVKIDRREFTA